MKLRPIQFERTLALLNISQHQVADVVVVDIDGDLTFGAATKRIHSLVQHLVEGGKRKILLNLARVHYIDSSGIGELISSIVTVEREEGQLKLLNVSSKVEEVLATCNLFSLFEVYDDELKAVYDYD